ncbi:hypothetical protein K1T35_47545 (plasmid) [Pseudonocardia sp. DSM 110487]|uniref:hypothetical protein n=1 Tax=Pseudonocardia sp. DSM 110487 TaxID=2865833 RepID=UPI001C69788C|nr:hypothetical protein [Pseudonocardia sp. DSM 110487]QYN41005.1 hypothetical protein K1T35_47545 [Pseudonocardia sp. DSM 110487]
MTTRWIRADAGPSVLAKRSGTCPTCHGISVRQRTFTAAFSPLGETRTWDELRRETAARAEAWAPDPDDFEHDSCRADRLAPPRATPQPVSATATLQAEQIRNATANVLARLTKLGLPAHRIDVGWRDIPGRLLEARFVVSSAEPGLLLLWARSLGVERITVDARPHATILLIRHVIDDVHWTITGQVPHNAGRDRRLGGAAVNWGRSRRTRDGRKSSIGTIDPDELAAGLARLGIPEIVSARPGASAE